MPEASQNVANSCPWRATSAKIVFEARQQRGKFGEKEPGTSTIVQIGRCDVNRQQKASCINENVALAPLDMLVGVKPADAVRLLERFHALCIDDRCTWVRVPAHTLTFGSPKDSE
ncbi:MAG: hypothetical protein NVSMB42_13940 [Herpetosiphon sp.]